MIQNNKLYIFLQFEKIHDHDKLCQKIYTRQKTQMISILIEIFWNRIFNETCLNILVYAIATLKCTNVDL